MITREIRPAARVAARREHLGTRPGDGRLVHPPTVVKGGIEDVPRASLSLFQMSSAGLS
ncbi:hypothetical protein [Streptosporangium sp. NPDC002721]|uniref:hypothetical protein n=1 Tax=Streptosporangium sp. NPDC002721 TaxID=3366188 RepID=UPI00368EC028